MSKDIIEKLKSDEHYYGEFGKQYLSNSDIATLLKDPLSLGKPSKASTAFLVGGYFHTCILEPDKLKKYKVIESSTRNTKLYKELSGGDLCLLQHEVDQIELLSEKILNNKVCRDLIQGANIIYEQPGITELEGNMWKGKADIINKNEKLIIDLKTTNDITMFRRSASKYNYDSQAFIYSKIFGYEFMFIVIDKNTKQIGLYDCSDDFLNRGYDKVKRASEAYDLFYNTENFDATQYFINNTL
jgi:hypothetical protein|tara:strand:+ start:1523 stop:2251 length:729 start_codon:yes stop_codon:yes gene_type:complete